MKVSLASNYLANSNLSNLKRYTPNIQTNFKGLKDEIKEESEQTKSQGSNKETRVSLFACLVAAAIAGGVVNNRNAKDKAEYQDAIRESFVNILKDKNIKKNSFTVKEVNNDDSPEIIFEKKDGTKVAFDVKNNKCFNPDNTNDASGKVQDKDIKGAPEIKRPSAKSLYSLPLIYGEDDARALAEQIYGPSSKEKTLEIFDSIPDVNLLAAVKAYCSTSKRLQFCVTDYLSDDLTATKMKEVKKGMFEALNDERGIGIKELHPRINRVLKIAAQKGCKDLPEYKEIKAILDATNPNAIGNFSKKDIKKIDSLFNKLLP